MITRFHELKIKTIKSMRNNQFKTITAMCAIATSLFIASCNNNSTKENSTAQTEAHLHSEGEHHEHIYACPMHPEVTGKEGDKCPKCGMTLEHQDEAPAKGNFQMQFTSSPQSIEAGKAATLSFTPKNKDNTNAAVPLDVEHEKKIHLIVVSEDLSWFSHIHPEYQTDGSYTVTETFPVGGNYFLFADYKPSGSTHQLEKIRVTVKGAAKQPVTYATAKLISKTDGYNVNFVNGNELKSGVEGHLIVNIEKNGKLINPSEIEKYLGANAHIVIVGLDNKEYLHVHPEANEFPIHAHTMISKPGIYRMWLQFQTGGKVHTADFVLNVVAGVASTTETNANNYSGHSQKH
jgi:hypothetical protein